MSDILNNPRDIQTIFNIAIESGHYNKWVDWMCGALKECRKEGLITQQEYDIACSDIDNYIDITGYGFLESALKCSGLPFRFADRLAVYKDWANRPTLNPHCMI